MRTWRLPLWATLVVLGLASGLSPARAQDKHPLIPFVGETLEEFEARTRGELPSAGPASVTLTADARGHFAANAVINSARIRMVVDTGATVVTLSERDARSIGIASSPRDFTMKLGTANGVMLAAPVVLHDVAIGEIMVHDVEAVVVPEDRLQVSLLGMSFLSKLSRFEISGGRLLLRR